MPFASLDWALRGGTCALLLLLMAVLLRDHGRQASARLAAGFALGTAAYAVTSAAGYPAIAGAWSMPLLALSAGNNTVFWAFSAALFDDGFRLRWWHAALWLLLVAAGVAMCLSPSAPLGLALTLSAVVFAALAMIPAITSWRVDLVERRRRLRFFVVVASSLYIGVTAVAQLAGVPHRAPAEGSLAGAIGLLAISAVVALSLVRVSHDSLFPMLAEAPQPVAPAATPAPDQGLLAALEKLMTTERTYRQDGLTIGTLASRLGLPEYRLRRLINQRLGYRNFNSFVNRYRIAEAKAALADPHQAEVPVLTIALDTGFNSLGPFNRAFKAETGLTPTEYRRQARGKDGAKAANSAIGQPILESASRISNPARGNLATH
jgi:AraC-like DNA-binding protein